MAGGGSSAARSTLGTKEFVVPPSPLSAASHNANAGQARRRCGSVKAVIPQSHAAYAVGSMAIPFVGWRAYLTNINRQRHKSQIYQPSLRAGFGAAIQGSKAKRYARNPDEAAHPTAN
jgi:hypothetical protein